MAKKTTKEPKGKAPKKRGQAKNRNVVPAESDRPVAHDLDQVEDHGDEVRDRRGQPEDRKLTPQQRALAEALVADPERMGWRAAWLAGYRGGGPDVPLPESREQRQALARAASTQLAKPWVKAYVDELEARAAAAFLGSPEGAAVREHVAARESGQADLEQLAARNLAVMAAIALHDPRSAVQWGPGWVTVTASDDLSYEEALLIREIEHKEVTFGEDGVRTETRVKLADRAPFVKLLEQRVGKSAPVRHEISGPGGGPIEAAVSVAQAPDSELLEECGRELLGVAPGSVSGADAGLAPEEVVAILKGWSDDPDPHVSQVWDLFSEDHLEESRARYLDDGD